MTLPKRSEGPPSGLPSWCRVGAKVVCVDASPRVWKWNGDAPEAGGIYTIKRIVDAPDAATYPWSLHLVELKRADTAIAKWGDEVGYSADRFRPLITLEADLEAHFSQLLHVPSTHTVDA